MEETVKEGIVMEYKYELTSLVTRLEDIEKMKKGEKTAVRRSNRFGNIGDTWEVDGEIFMLENVYKQKLGEVTEENAKQEGYASLEEYKQAITSIHDGSVWNPNLEVWVHEFKKAS